MEKTHSTQSQTRTRATKDADKTESDTTSRKHPKHPRGDHETHQSRDTVRVAYLREHLKHTSPSLDTEGAAEFIGVSPATMRDWKCQRIGPPYIQLSPRCVRYLQTDLEKFVADRRVVPSVRDVGRSRRATLRKTKQSV